MLIRTVYSRPSGFFRPQGRRSRRQSTVRSSVRPLRSPINKWYDGRRASMSGTKSALVLRRTSNFTLEYSRTAVIWSITSSAVRRVYRRASCNLSCAFRIRSSILHGHLPRRNGRPRQTVLRLSLSRFAVKWLLYSPNGRADVHFRSIYPDSSLHCETTDTLILHRVVCMLIS